MRARGRSSPARRRCSRAKCRRSAACTFPFPPRARTPSPWPSTCAGSHAFSTSERVDLVHARSRAAAWVALGACRKLKVAAGHGCSRRRAGRPAALELRSGGGGGRHRRRLLAIRRRPRGGGLSRRAPAAENRASGARFRQARAEADQPRAGGRGSRGLGRRAARTGGARSGPSGAVARAKARHRGRGPVAGEGPFGHPLRARGRGGETVLCARTRRAGRRARRQGRSLRESGPLADPPAAFVGASVAVFAASEPEGVGRTAIEAAAMGALTIVADVGPAREIVLAPPYAPPERVPAGSFRPATRRRSPPPSSRR